MRTVPQRKDSNPANVLIELGEDVLAKSNSTEVAFDLISSKKRHKFVKIEGEVSTERNIKVSSDMFLQNSAESNLLEQKTIFEDVNHQNEILNPEVIRKSIDSIKSIGVDISS